MRNLTCARCQQGVFFEDALCSACGAALGFDPERLAMASFEFDADGIWQPVGDTPAGLKPCGNYAIEHVCNWVLADDGSDHTLCRCCRTTQIIPTLTSEHKRELWSRLERAKRRLFYGLAVLGLPAPSKTEDPEHGVAFQFLEEVTPKEKVLTGHDEGLITLNVAEADDAKREGLRAHLHEPYRTLVGHFRHEIGHYYWDRLICESPWIDDFRALFGDERADYAEALKKHYADPVHDWPVQYISSYASSHPWEDWAECWAHYMHILDGLETASTWGVHLQQSLPGTPHVVPAPLDGSTDAIHDALVEQWLPVSRFVNSMNRSLGVPDSYPFVLVEPVIVKLGFIHKVVAAAASGRVAMRFGSTAPTEPVGGDAEVAPSAGGGPADATVTADAPPLPTTSAAPAPLPAAAT